METLQSEQKYVETMEPIDVLKERGIKISRCKNKPFWEWEYNGKIIPQPDPPFCYRTLVREFGIVEPRLEFFYK